MRDLLIKNGLVVDPASNIQGVYDVLIENGKIAKVGADICKSGISIIDATGLIVCPGFVDMHVHLRDPGFEYKEDIITGCEAAVSGGVTSLLCMPNTNPVTDNEKTIDYITKKSSNAKAHVYICAAMTDGLKGDNVGNFEMYKKAGVKAVSDDGRPVVNSQIMKEVITSASSNHLLPISHCEDLKIIDGGIVNEGKISKALAVKGMSRLSEDSITKREVDLAKELDLPIHIAHVSTAGSTEYIRQAKKNGVKVTAETCPHYFAFTDEKLLSKDADYRMNPPLREENDVLAIIEGIKDSTFDCIVTDHAPHTELEKADFFKAPNGVCGVETSFAAANTFLVKPGIINISKLVSLMAVNPARLLQINAGSIKVGTPADIAIIDLEKEWTVVPQMLHSKSKNTAFKNVKLSGKVIKTIVDGEIVYDELAGE
ncbi:MAG: dihydroorotase [Oscillospiraceae bacterium]